MPVTMNAGGTPDWSHVSANLQALVRRKGPVKVGLLSGQYRALHGRELNLGGKRVQACITDGILHGLRYDCTNNLLRLDDRKPIQKRSRASSDVHGKPAVTEVALKRSKPSPTTGAANWPQTSSDLQLLVKKRKRLRLGDVSGAYYAEFGRVLNLGGKGVSARIKDGTLPGLRVNGVSKEKYLSVKPAAAPVGGTKDVATRTKSISAKPPKPVNHTPALGGKATGAAPTTMVVPAKAISSATVPSYGQGFGDSSAGFLPPPSPAPRPANLPFILIDSDLSCTRALATLFRNGDSGATLQQLNNGDRVTMQLDGTNLGSEAGVISYVKVLCGRLKRTMYGTE